MEFLNKKQKIVLIIIGSLMIIFIGYYIVNKAERYNYEELEIIEENSIETKENTIQEEKIEKKIIVHITGEVENEGIVELDENSRIADVIKEAGGATEEADLSRINLAYSVKDGQKINIPNKNEESDEKEYVTETPGDNIIEGENKESDRVNINTAPQTELETLSGIGPSTSLKIINYRNENGKFNTIEDIKNVPGIGEAKFENIKEDICV